MEFETQLEYGGHYGQGIVNVDEDGEERLFKGLAYDLHSNGKLESYLYVSGGVKEGRYVFTQAALSHPSGPCIRALRTDISWNSMKTAGCGRSLRAWPASGSRSGPMTKTGTY